MATTKNYRKDLEAALRFLLVAELADEGYGEYVHLFEEEI